MSHAEGPLCPVCGQPWTSDHNQGNDLAATNPDATTSPANPQGGAEQELRQELKHLIECAKKGDATYAVANQIEKLITKHTAAAYTQGYDDCLREHGAVFKGEEK